MTLVLTLVLMSCTSLRTNANNLYWSPVPDPIVNGENVLIKVHEGETITATENGVFVPAWYWLQIEKYIIITEGNIEKLE